MIQSVLLISSAAILFILIIIIVTGKKEKIPVFKSFYVLGTIVQLKVYGRKAEKAVAEVLERLNDIDDKMSVFKEYSEISKINLNAGQSPQKVSEDTYFVIKNAVKYSEISEGAFDPTIRPVVALWNIGTNKARVPNDSEIKEKLRLVNYKDIILNENEKSIKLNKRNQAIDVGGIAKGYAADEVKNVLIRNHIKSAIIDLGGNIFVLGRKEGGNLWRVGVQNPFKPRGEYVGIVDVGNKSVVTSGNYERYFMDGKRKLHHIIDPKTGHPSDSRVVSATIISDKSLDGDGLSTGVYIMGVEKALKLIESIEGVDAVFITEDKKVYCTTGIRENFSLENNEFIYGAGVVA